MIEELEQSSRLDVRFGERNLVRQELWRALDFVEAAEWGIQCGNEWAVTDLINAQKDLQDAEIRLTQFAINDFMALG